MKALFFLLLTFGAIVVCNITIVAGNTESQTLTAYPYLISEPVLASIDNLLSAILKLYRSCIIALRKFIYEELELVRNGSSQGSIGGQFKWNLWKDQVYHYGGSLQDMIIYMQKEIMDAETKLEFVIKYLNGLVDGTIAPPQQLPAEAVQIIFHIWSDLRFSINRLNEDADTFRSYVFARINFLKNRFGEGSFEFHAMMKIVYHEVDTRSIQWVNIVGPAFRKALTLPRASYYVTDLQTFYAEWPTFLNLTPESTVVDYLIQSKSLANTIYNAAQVHCFLPVSMRLRSNTWAYMNLIFQDASNTSRFLEQGWNRIESYLRSSLNLIQLQIEAQNYEQADAQMLNVRSQAESDIKMLLDFTETPYQRIHDALHSDYFETYATDSRYTGSFQNLLLYLAEKGYPISWDENEFASISERVTVVADTSDTGAALTYYSKSNFRTVANENKSGNDEKYLQSHSVYYLILHDQVLRDIISVYYNLLNDLRSFLPPDEVFKVVLRNLREDAILFAQAYQYLRLYVSQSGLLIDWIQLETAQEYMYFLKRLDIDVTHRLDIFSYRVLSTFTRILDYMESVNSASQPATDTGGTLPAETAAPNDLNQDGLANENSEGLTNQPLVPIAENPVLGNNNSVCSPKNIQTTRLMLIEHGKIRPSLFILACVGSSHSIPQTPVNELPAESIPVEGGVDAGLSQGLQKQDEPPSATTTRDSTDQEDVPITDNSVLENNSVSSLKNIQTARLLLIEHGKINPYLLKLSGIQSSKATPQTTINELPVESIPAGGIIDAGASERGNFSTDTPQVINPSSTVTPTIPTRGNLDDAEFGKKPYLPKQGTSKYVQPTAITTGVEQLQNIPDVAMPESTVADDNLNTQNPGVTISTTPRGLNEDNFGKREGKPGLEQQATTYASPVENSNPITATDNIIDGVVPGSTDEEVIPISPAAETFMSSPGGSNAENFGKRGGMSKLFTPFKPTINNVNPGQIQATDETNGGNIEVAAPTNEEIAPGIESVTSPRGINGDNFGKRPGLPDLYSPTTIKNPDQILETGNTNEGNGEDLGSTNEEVIPMSPTPEIITSSPGVSNAENFGKREGMSNFFSPSKPSPNTVNLSQIQATNETNGEDIEVAGPVNEEIVPNDQSVTASPRAINVDNFGKKDGMPDIYPRNINYLPTNVQNPGQMLETNNTNGSDGEFQESTNEEITPKAPAAEAFTPSPSNMNGEHFGKREGIFDIFTPGIASSINNNDNQISATEDLNGENLEAAGAASTNEEIIPTTPPVETFIPIQSSNGENFGKREGMLGLFPQPTINSSNNNNPSQIPLVLPVLENENAVIDNPAIENETGGEVFPVYENGTLEELNPTINNGITEETTPTLQNETPVVDNPAIENETGGEVFPVHENGTLEELNPTINNGITEETTPTLQNETPVVDNPAIENETGGEVFPIHENGTLEELNPTINNGITEETTPTLQNETPGVDNPIIENGPEGEVFPVYENGTQEVLNPTINNGITEETTPTLQNETPVVDNPAIENEIGGEVFPVHENRTLEELNPTINNGITEETTPTLQNETPVVDNPIIENGTEGEVFPIHENGTLEELNPTINNGITEETTPTLQNETPVVDNPAIENETGGEVFPVHENRTLEELNPTINNGITEETTPTLQNETPVVDNPIIENGTEGEVFPIHENGTLEELNPTINNGITEETTPTLQNETPVVDNPAIENGTGGEVFPVYENGTLEELNPTINNGITEETTPTLQNETPVVDNPAIENETGKEVFPVHENGTLEELNPTINNGITEETTPTLQNETPVVDNPAIENETGGEVFPVLDNGAPEVSPSSNNETPEGEGSSPMKQEEIDAALDLLSSLFKSIDTDGNGEADILLIDDAEFTHKEDNTSIDGVLPVDLNGDGSPDATGTLASRQKIIEDKGVLVLGDLNPDDGLLTNTIIETTKTTEEANTVLNIVLGTQEQQQLQN